MINTTKQPTVAHVEALLLERIAPPQAVMEGDNIGLLVGDPQQAVTTIFVALDVSRELIAEAQAAGAQLIVTHHPVLFRGTRTLREDEPEGALIRALVRANISLIAAHTNWDSAPGGTGDALLAALGYTAVAGEGYLRLTVLPNPILLSELAAQVRSTLGDVVRCYPAGEKPVQRLAVSTGAGDIELEQAVRLGADVFLTGECGYHKALDVVQRGMAVLEAGHRATELPGARALAEALQSAANALQYTVRVFYADHAPRGRGE